jgi:hypothetical protein
MGFLSWFVKHDDRNAVRIDKEAAAPDIPDRSGGNCGDHTEYDRRAAYAAWWNG